MSVRLSVPCHAASAPSPDDGQDAAAELPETGTLGPSAQPHLMGCCAGNRLASTRTPSSPTTAPGVNQRNEVQFYGVAAAPMPSHVAEGDVSLARVPARMT